MTTFTVDITNANEAERMIIAKYKIASAPKKVSAWNDFLAGNAFAALSFSEKLKTASGVWRTLSKEEQVIAAAKNRKEADERKAVVPKKEVGICSAILKTGARKGTPCGHKCDAAVGRCGLKGHGGVKAVVKKAEIEEAKEDDE